MSDKISVTDVILSHFVHMILSGIENKFVVILRKDPPPTALELLKAYDVYIPQLSETEIHSMLDELFPNGVVTWDGLAEIAKKAGNDAERYLNRLRDCSLYPALHRIPGNVPEPTTQNEKE